jgi:hypothetical protein
MSMSMWSNGQSVRWVCIWLLCKNFERQQYCIMYAIVIILAQELITSVLN